MSRSPEYSMDHRHRVQLRLLDQDLATVLKAGEEFQWDRINFVLEAPPGVLYMNLSGLVEFLNYKS